MFRLEKGLGNNNTLQKSLVKDSPSPRTRTNAIFVARTLAIPSFIAPTVTERSAN